MDKILILLLVFLVLIVLVVFVFLIYKKSNSIERLTGETPELVVSFDDLSENILGRFRDFLGDILANLDEDIETDRVKNEIDTKISTLFTSVKDINKNPKYTKETNIPTNSRLGKFNILLNDLQDWKNKQSLKSQIMFMRTALLNELDSKMSKEHS